VGFVPTASTGERLKSRGNWNRQMKLVKGKGKGVP